MKAKLIADLDKKHKKGDEVDVIAIRYSTKHAGNYAVKVAGAWKAPKWLSINWIAPNPKTREFMKGVKRATKTNQT